MKQLIFIAFVALLIVNGNSFSQTVTLLPGTTQTQSNPLFFSVTTQCTVQTSGSNQVCMKVIKGNVKQNGQTYNAGSSSCSVFTNNEQTSSTTGASTTLQLTNNGKSQVVMNCQVSLQQEKFLSQLIDMKEYLTSFFSQTVTLLPGTTQQQSNPLFFSVKTQCTVQTVGQNQVCVKVLKGTVSQNGQTLNAGQSACTVFSNNQQTSSTTGGSTSLQITNNGKNQVVMNCQVSL